MVPEKTSPPAGTRPRRPGGPPARRTSRRFSALVLAGLLLPAVLGAAGKDGRKDEVPEGRVEVKETEAENLVFIVALDQVSEEVLKVDYDARFARIPVPCAQGEPAEGCTRTVLRRIGFPPRVDNPGRACPGGLSLMAVFMAGRPVTETRPRHDVRPKRDLRWYLAGSIMNEGGTVRALYDCPADQGASPAPTSEPPP